MDGFSLTFFQVIYKKRAEKRDQEFACILTQLTQLIRK